MDEKMVEVMLDIQQRLHVPKDQFNQHGNFKYRTCEGILTALKPILAEHKAILWFDDEVVNIDGWKYMKATVNMQFANDRISCTGYAREAEQQKGMNAAQITGAASSYARKYALCGMFGIDDGNDPDSQSDQQLSNNQRNQNRSQNNSRGRKNAQNNQQQREQRGQQQETAGENRFFSEEQLKSMRDAYLAHKEVYQKLCSDFKIKTPQDIPNSDTARLFYDELIKRTIAADRVPAGAGA